MMTELPRVYVIVPRCLDLPNGKKLSMTCGRAMGHASHAAALLQEQLSMFPVGQNRIFDMDLIVLMVANGEELRATQTLLCKESLPYMMYFDEDRIYEGKMLTALATLPMDKKQRSKLHHLRPWKCACNEIQFSDTLVETMKGVADSFGPAKEMDDMLIRSQHSEQE